MLRFLTAPVHTLAETCSLAQLGYAKDSQGNWSKAQTSCLDCRFATPSSPRLFTLCLKRVRQPRNLRVRTSNLNG